MFLFNSSIIKSGVSLSVIDFTFKPKASLEMKFLNKTQVVRDYGEDFSKKHTPLKQHVSVLDAIQK